MKLHRTLLCLPLVLGPWAAAHAQAQPGPETPRPVEARPTATSPLTVAILDFGADNAGAGNVGQQIATALTALLTGEEGFTLVERGRLDAALEEQEMNLSGLADTSQAVQIGKLVGARLIVTGKAFPLGDKLFITAKLIGTETTLVDAVLVKGAPAHLDDLVGELAMKVAERIRDNGGNLVAQPAVTDDPVPVLRERLATRVLPVVAVVVPERHIGAAQPAPDPAVETELKLLFRRCGFELIDTRQNDLADWARNLHEHDPDNWPRSLAGADIVVIGEAFSEFAGRIGNLTSAAGRCEINVVDRRTGRILVADRTTTRGVDLSENIAGRNALQKAGHTLGLRILGQLADTLPAKDEREPSPAPAD